ncbi:MAG: diguanylate cyclase [Butyrivibrio sp.]|nr:diguanylate cyclase [Butyrivibrio sp.]
MGKSYFEWNQDFETGNKLIDEQHFGLVELINELIGIDLNTDSGAPKKIDEINQKLNDYVIQHFNTEENLMKKYCIDQRHVKVHLLMHQEFVEKVNQNQAKGALFSENNNMTDFIEYLIQWLAYHMLNTDKSLFRQIEYIEKNNISPREAYDIDVKNIECATGPLLKALKALYYLVSEKNKELEDKNRELEDRVEKRTKDLLAANEKLEKISIIDELTKLNNRRFFISELELQMYNWQRYHEPFSLIYLDADKFKLVNDNYGHDIGDYVLKWISKFIQKNIRKTDIACRLGGDEFVVICQRCGRNEAIHVGEKIYIKCKNESNEEIIKYWKPSLSIGIASVDESIHSVEDILKKADSAMYQSKKLGGNQYSIFGE